MLSLYNIYTIARFEIKTLSRSWFLRIFAALSIIIIFMMNLALFTNAFGSYTPRDMYGLTSSIINANFVFFNLAQAIITVFLASDFLKRDKKLDTTEAIYIRSMNNTDYIAGKALGIFTIFMILNLFILLISLCINIFGNQPNISFESYLYYPLILSVPTLVFIIGLTFLFMTVVKNQAITFIILLGYIGVTLFYLGVKFDYIFDYTGFHIPLVYSDFIGFGNSTQLFLHRVAYLLLGFGFISLTMYFFRRLPQSKVMLRASLVFGILCVLTGAGAVIKYIDNLNAGETLREEMILLNNNYKNYPVLSVSDYQIDIEHLGNTIQCESILRLKNNSGKDLDKIIFNLNPGLSIKSILLNGNEAKFIREHHLLIINLDNVINQNDSYSLHINYGGGIDDNATNIFVDETKRLRPNRVWIYLSDKIYSFVSPDYVLLTKEAMWYPTPGVTYSPEAQFSQNINFANYKTEVKTSESLTPISQGKTRKGENGIYSFISDQPLAQISLIIGKYSKKSIIVDSLNYNLYTYKTHNYYEEYLEEVNDTLSALIRELKEDYERDLNFTYPYEQVNIVEAPVQFTSYSKLWTNARETVQPEIILFPENGSNVDGADFRRSQRMRERRQDRSNQVTTPKEEQAEIFKQFVRTTFYNSGAFMRFGSGDITDNLQNPFSIFPLYYSYTYNVKSEYSPILNIALENYFKIKSEIGNSGFVRSRMGLTASESAVQKLASNSLEKIIQDTTYNQYLKEILELKGEILFTTIENAVGIVKLKPSLREFLGENKFRQTDYGEFENLLKNKYNFELTPVISEWYSNNELPAYYLTNFDNYMLIDENREKYQVKFNITNPTNTKGFVKIKFDPRRGGERMGRFGRNRSGEQDESILEKTLMIDSNQTIKVGVLLDEQPGRLSLNTLVSQNLPLQQEFNFEEFEEKKKAVSFEGEQILDQIVSYSNPDEIIVDNEDEGFETTKSESTSWLKNILNIDNEEDQKYIGLRFWDIPNNWHATIVSEAYGKFVHSVHFTKTGEGEVKAIWNTKIASSGYYDVYTHIVKPRIGSGRRRRSSEDSENSYVVYHDDGSDEVSFDIKNSDDGWNLIGSYYFSEGETKVELTNKAKGIAVFADAVKWVSRD